LTAWAVLIAVVCAPAVARAAAGQRADKALWEVGVIGGGGLIPDYPAASETQTTGIGSPYLLYRGKVWRVGDDSIVSGRLAHKRDWAFDISLDGSFPADSKHNKARKGMPDLDWLGEIGPRFQYTILRAARDAKIDFELPVRSVFSVKLKDLDFRGLIAAPRIAYQHENFFATDLEFKISFGGNFGTTALANYFYRVPAGFSTPSRPLYKARGGYFGSSLNLGITRPITPKLKLYLLGVANFHYGAANDNSPLFRDKMTFGIGGAVRWSFYQSAKRAYH